MKNWEEVISHQTFCILDHTNIKSFQNKPYTALTSFAIDDAIATAVSANTAPPALRLWVHDNTIVLGIPDGRLPYLDEGVEYLKSAGFDVIIRNSGGLAVALDKHVINLSLILPNMRSISIQDSYEAMVSFIQYMFRDLTDEIEAYEIVGSYCPGDYDLSINGKKFAGISQRRINDAAAVQIYLDVDGDTKTRAEHIQKFYQLSKKNEDTTFTYPEVRPEVMASLSDLLGVSLTVEEVKKRVYDALEHFTEEIIHTEFTNQEQETFERRYDQMISRNEKIR